MSVVTESILRRELKNSSIDEYEVEKGALVTPSARQYLSDRSIKLIYKEEYQETSDENIKKEVEGFIPKYVHINGGVFEKKPEYMTQLYGNKLVSKDHKRIIFRGKLDSLQAKILETQLDCINLNEKEVVKDLEEVLSFVRNVLAAEVLEKEFIFNNLIGLNSDELRAYSHNPKKYFNTEHIIYPSAEMGPIIVVLNALRAQTREVEICAYQAFKNEDGDYIRSDIGVALNRLSSCFYIMMCKYAAGKYSKRCAKI
ncbi:MAG: cobalamin adenosyltransferase [Sedimentibacter sp.]